MPQPPAERRGTAARPLPRFALACALLAALTLAALGGVLGNGFVNYDDDLYVTANPQLLHAPAPDAVRWAFTTTRGGNWHPLTWLSHLLDARLFGLEPAGHHAVSLGLHLANALLLLALLRSLTGALWPSALAAALFAVHPLRVESVAWVAERKDLLSTLFALLAALAWARGLRRRGGGTGGWPAAGAAALLALALMAKAMPVSLPLLLLLLDWWPLGRWAPAGRPPGSAAPVLRLLPPARLWLEKAPLFAVACVATAVAWAAQHGEGAMRATAGVPLPARAVNALVSYAAYLRQAAWPAGLGAFYPYPWAGHPPLTVALAAAALAALALLAVHAAARRPWVPVGLLWFGVALAPAIGLVQIGEQALADRYTYVPLAGVALAAAWELARAGAGSRRVARLAAAGALAALVALAAAAAWQVSTWRDGVSLFTRALAVTRGNHIAHNNLGTALLVRGRVEESLPHFEETIRIAPGASKGYLNLGRALALLGRHEEALARFREAAARDPRDPLAWRGLAQSLERLGRRGEAVAAWREALALQPGSPRALDELGVALARAGRPAEAVPLLEAAAALAPGDGTIRAHLAVARSQLAGKGAGGGAGVGVSP